MNNIKKMSFGRLKDICNSNWFAFTIRFTFVLFLIMGERMFLGPVSRARGRADILLSIGMMLLLVIVIDRYANRIFKKPLLIIAGVFFIFFQLLTDLYYRFFHCAIPFDIIHQWHDFFVIGGYGSGLLSQSELAVAVIIPCILLFLLVFTPFKPRPIVIIALVAVVAFGWNHRLNRSVIRNGKEMSSLPDYIHKQFYYLAKVGMGKNRYLQIVHDVQASIPRNLKGYKVVKDNGIMVEPVELVQDTAQKRYNIIFILMESMRANECGFLGAETSFTPKLDSLAKNALVYNNFYANGCQTVRAELASLCSVYTNPIGVPDYLINPSMKLISLPQILNDSGYDTLWFSGYTADFHNKGKFLTNHGIKKIYDRDVMPKAKQPEIGWGMNDSELFDNVWDVLKDAKGPFFAQVTTLSNHVATDVTYPTESETPKVKGSKRYKRYTNGIYYTDYAVSKFIEKVRNSKFGDNTIIVAMGDHGLWIFPDEVNDTVRKVEMMFRVPLCIWGPSNIIKPGMDNTIGSQVDLAPTLLDLLDIKQKNTFLGQSLADKDIPQDQRYVFTLLGSIANIRVGDIFSVSKSRLNEKDLGEISYGKVENTDSYQKDIYDYISVKGDLLRGRYTAVPVTDEAQKTIFTKRIDDIVFLTSYSVYKNAYQGLE